MSPGSRYPGLSANFQLIWPSWLEEIFQGSLEASIATNSISYLIHYLANLHDCQPGARRLFTTQEAESCIGHGKQTDPIFNVTLLRIMEL